MDQLNELWSFIVDHGIATDDELSLITDINGYNIDALNDVIYARTGYRSMSQLLDTDNEEE